MNRLRLDMATARLPLRRRRGTGAFTLVETVISILIIGVVMVAAMNTVGASRMAQYTHTQRSRGLLLAQDLMTEILQHPYWDPVAESGMGPVASETVTGNRTLFNDIDDYDDWVASPPEYRDGTPIAWASGYERQVDVCWLNTGNLNEKLSNETGIKKIEVSGDRVTGVITEQGERFPADYIVSNANPIHCCHDLIGAENVPASYLKSLGEGRIAVSTFNVYLGLDCPAEDLGLTSHEMFVSDSYDMEDHYRGMFKIGRQKYYVITTYNASDPEFSPPGTTVVVLTGLHDYEAWSRIPPDKYVEEKSRMAGEMIDAANEVAPGLKDHIAVMETATPITNMRYSGNPGGSILGFDYDLTGTPALRLPNRGPLKGLYFANAWVRLGGGYEPCITSGYLACGEIMKDLKGAGTLQRLLPSFG